MDRIKTEIDIAIKGNSKIVQVQKNLGRLAAEVLHVNKSSKTLVDNFVNINDQLNLANKVFNNAASGTTAYRKAVETLVKTESNYNQELIKRNNLIRGFKGAQSMGLAVDPVMKSILRKRKFQPSTPAGSGFKEFSQQFDSRGVRLEGQTSPVGARIEKIIANRKKSEQEIADIRNRALQKVQENEQRLITLRKNAIRSASGNTGVFSSSAGNLVQRGSITGTASQGSRIKSMHKTGFSAFSARADEIARLTTEEQNLNNIRVKASKDLKVLTRRNDRLLRVQKGRNKQQSLRNAQSNALIGGAFPLLFGQGVGAAAGGAAGGFAGGMMGGQFGFALSLVGTNLGSLVDRLVSSTSEIGKALGPFTANVDAVVSSLGVAGTAFGQQLNTYTQVADKTDSLNEATRQMAIIVGNDGVKALRQFGESSTQLKNDFDRAMLGMQVAVAKVATFIANRFKIFDKEGTGGLKNRARQTFLRGDDKVTEEIKRKEKAIISAPFDAEKGVTVDGQTFKNKKDALAFLKEQRLERQKQIDLENAGLLVQKTVQQIAGNKLEGLQEENLFLEDKLKKGNVQAEIEKRMRALTKDVLGDQKELTKTQITQIENQRDSITKAVKYNDELQKSVAFSQQLKDVLSTGVTDAVMGLIDGTKTLSQSLAGIARQLASMFLNRAFSAMFGNFFGEQGGYSRSGSFKAFQYGGVVNSPTLGMVGEGGEPEYIIPASKMDGAMARYSAGARGGAVIPGGSHEAGTVAGASGSTVVEYTGPILNFNGDDYVPKDSVPQIINAAAKQGATLGQSRTLNTLKNSRSSRAKIGL